MGKFQKDVLSNKHAPLESRRLKSRQNPWIDNAIVKLMHRRDYLKRKAVSTKNSQLWKAYKLIRNKITATIRRAKKEYYRSSIEENKGNPSKLWRILGKLTGSKHKEEIPVHLTADQFNLFFSKIGLDAVAQLKPKQNDSKSGENHIYWRGSKCISNFNITEVPNASIENLLSALGDKSSNDILGFDSKLLWLCCDIISPLITKFVNASIITNHVLLDWKVSRVTPVYKGKGTKTEEGNYRPISVIGHVAKILERVIQKQLMSYLKKQ